MRKLAMILALVLLASALPHALAASRDGLRTDRERAQSPSAATTQDDGVARADRTLARIERSLALRLWLQLRALGLADEAPIGTYVIDGPDPIGNSDDEGESEGDGKEEEEQGSGSSAGTMGGRSQAPPGTQD